MELKKVIVGAPDLSTASKETCLSYAIPGLFTQSALLVATVNDRSIWKS